MPIFKFICTECGKHFEQIMKHSELETELIECRECSSDEFVERVLTAPGSYQINGNNSASTRPNFSKRSK